MNQETRPPQRRDGRGGRRPNYRNNRGPRRDDRQPRSNDRERREPAAKKLTFWQKVIAFFTGGKKKAAATAPAARTTHPAYDNKSQDKKQERNESRPARKPEPIEVTSPKLYIGNLSYDATESDLFDLFKGIGQVQNAEVVTHRDTYKSKGFGFVTMITVDEAKRAVTELHDKEFMGRKLTVSGSKSDGPRERDFSGRN